MPNKALWVQDGVPDCLGHTIQRRGRASQVCHRTRPQLRSADYSWQNKSTKKGESGIPQLRLPRFVDLPSSDIEAASQGQHVKQAESNSPRDANTLQKGSDAMRGHFVKLVESIVEKCLLEVKGIFDDLATIKIEIDEPKDVQHQQPTSFDQRIDSVSYELRQTRDEVTISTNQPQQDLTDLRAQVSDLQRQVHILASKLANGVSAIDHANGFAIPRVQTAELSRPLSDTRSHNNTTRKLPSRELISSQATLPR